MPEKKHSRIRVLRDGRDVITPVDLSEGYGVLPAILDNAEPGKDLILPCGIYKVRSIGYANAGGQIIKTVNVDLVMRSGVVPEYEHTASHEKVLDAVLGLIDEESAAIDAMEFDPAEDANEHTFEHKKDLWKAELRSLRIRALTSFGARFGGRTQPFVVCYRPDAVHNACIEKTDPHLGLDNADIQEAPQAEVFAGIYHAGSKTEAELLAAKAEQCDPACLIARPCLGHHRKPPFATE